VFRQLLARVSIVTHLDTNSYPILNPDDILI
jgi:hypothetical protein